MATAEREVEIAQSPELLETIVPLFHYSQTEWTSSRDFYKKMSKYSADYRKSSEYWDNKFNETTGIISRIGDRVKQASMNLIASISFITCGKVYLKFLDEFTAKGLNQTEIFNFFRLCLDINTKGSQVYESNEANAERVSLRERSPDFLQRVLMPTIQKAMHNIPSWFKGSKAEYLDFLNYHSSFGLVIDPETQTWTDQERMLSDKKRAREIMAGKKPSEYWGATISEGIPDWADGNIPPDREIVELELEHDLKENELIAQERAGLIRGQKYFQVSFNEKFTRYKDRFKQKWDEIRIEHPKLGDYLTYLYLIPDCDLNSLIRIYTQSSQRIFDSELQSLWIEDNFKRSGVIQSGSITNEGRGLLELMLYNLRGLSSQDEREKLMPIKQTNKVAHDAIRFKILPLINILIDEDILLLSDFLDEKKEAGSFISFFADVVVSRLKTLKVNENPDLDRLFTDYKEFIGKFLRKNWQNLYQDFEGYLFGTNRRVPILPNGINFEEENDEVLLEREIEQFQKSNLDGWKIAYSDDQTTYPSSLIEVTGDSLDDKCASLQSIVLRLGVSSSVKLTSVAHAIDWKTQVSPEIEQLVPAITVKGERWKKMKRQNIRILYQMDQQNKSFVFFIYQKTGWSYNLPAA